MCKRILLNCNYLLKLHGKNYSFLHTPRHFKETHEYGVESKFVLCRYHTPIKRGTLLAITRPAIFEQVYHTRKKEKEKEKKYCYSINKN
jgi:hypothetical protein